MTTLLSKAGAKRTYRLLFVDDEPFILTALRRVLRRVRREWRAEFISSGDEAVQAHSRQPFDAVISDMRMPGMDGAEVVRKVYEGCPSGLRIGLSGYSESRRLVDSAGYFHQFWSKPCNLESLVCSLEAAFQIGEPLPSELRSYLCALKRFPCAGETCVELRSLLAKDSPDPSRIGKLVHEDLGLYLNLLRLFNSSFVVEARSVGYRSSLEQVLHQEQVRKGLLMAARPQEQGESLLRTDEFTRRLCWLAPRLAALDGAGLSSQRAVWMGARLSSLGRHLGDAEGKIGLLLRSSPNLALEAARYLLAVWGTPEEILDTLRPYQESDTGETGEPRDYVWLAEALLRDEAPVLERQEQWCAWHSKSLPALLGEVEQGCENGEWVRLESDER